MHQEIHFRNKIYYTSSYLKTKTSLKQNCFETKHVKKQNIHTKSKNTSRTHKNENVFKTKTF